jgi:hypothetical protein
MVGENIRYEQVQKLLPSGWEAKAKELKAFQAAKKITSPAELLQLILVYLTEGKSFAGTSAITSLIVKTPMSKTAVWKRIQKSARWLQWMSESICRQAGLAAEKPRWLKHKNVGIVDGSEVVKCGVRRQLHMLHYNLDLFTLSAREFLVTDIKTGEKLANFRDMGKDDIIMGDRAHGTLPGISCLRSRGAGCVLRVKGSGFALYNGRRQKIDLFASLSRLQAGKTADIAAKCLIDGHYEPIRMCAVRKDARSEQKGLKRLKKENQRKKGGKAVTSLQREGNKYIIVATSVGKAEASAAEILELYRLRWQAETAFKRLKSLFGYGDLPAAHPESVKAWFYGKLLLAALCETLANTGRFSPRQGQGEDNCDGFPPARQMSLWREQRIALAIVIAMLLGGMNRHELSDDLRRLPHVCKDSKRKRIPQSCFFSSA